MGRLWQVLFRHGVDVALNGHDHLYERFALMNPRGQRAPRSPGSASSPLELGDAALNAAGPLIRVVAAGHR